MAPVKAPRRRSKLVTYEIPNIRVPKFFFAVAQGGQLLNATVMRRASDSRGAATSYLPAGRAKTWKNCRDIGMHLIKVSIQPLPIARSRNIP